MSIVLPDDTVCPCLNDTGKRTVRLYERCQRCLNFMEADYVSERLALLADALHFIAYEMPTSELNPDGVEQAAHSMQAFAREALA